MLTPLYIPSENLAFRPFLVQFALVFTSLFLHFWLTYSSENWHVYNIDLVDENYETFFKWVKKFLGKKFFKTWKISKKLEFSEIFLKVYKRPQQGCRYILRWLKQLLGL